jgi:hypothetical protein
MITVLLFCFNQYEKKNKNEIDFNEHLHDVLKILYVIMVVAIGQDLEDVQVE